MRDILIIIGFLMIGGLGYWVMGKIDKFISSDNWRPEPRGYDGISSTIDTQDTHKSAQTDDTACGKYSAEGKTKLLTAAVPAQTPCPCFKKT